MILVRRETTPDDYHGMIASQGILTSAGGTNSHAAVVARGEGIPAVCGADAHQARRRRDGPFTANGTAVRRGRRDHDRRLHRQRLRGRAAARGVAAGEGARRATPRPREEPIWKAFERADGAAPTSAAGLRVRANADTPDQATNARERGAEGIGLCRTEHMFLGRGARRRRAADDLRRDARRRSRPPTTRSLPLQQDDFVGIFNAMDGLPVTVRLLDPPLHEFLPDQVDLAVEVALGEERGRGRRPSRRRVLQKVDELHEVNPMLGLRGVRLGIVKPGLYAMQVRAIVEAAVQVRAGRRRPDRSRS